MLRTEVSHHSPKVSAPLMFIASLSFIEMHSVYNKLWQWPAAFLLLVIPLISFGQEQLPPVQQEQVVRDPQAISLVQKSLTAMGIAQWQESSVIQMKGNFDLYQGKQQTGTFSLSEHGSGDMNVSMADEAGQSVSYQRVSKIVTMNLPTKAAQQLPYHKLHNLPPYFLPQLLSEAMADTSYSVFSLGQQSINGVACEKLEIKHTYLTSYDAMQMLSKFTQKYVYIDTSTTLVNRVEYETYDNKNIHIHRTSTLDYSAYQHIGSNFFPTSITEQINGMAIAHILLSTIQ